MKVKVTSHARRTRLVDWHQVDQHEWRSGNVRIIAVDEGDWWLRWYVKIKHSGRWYWAYCEQRPWAYGSAGQAKRGVSKWKNIYLYEQGPQSETAQRMKGR